MKKIIFLLLILILALTSALCQAMDFPGLSGGYLGQKEPGPTPELK
ncbi:MAG TPA: hypothetical protein VLQ89_05685 [Candidatus Binatia bacterium]|nr:hypothetical protein [Candidatus Binatia bacterium]